MLFTISVITAIDRVNISVAAKYMMPEFGFSPVRMGVLFSVFTLGYGVFQFPAGLLADKFGPRRLLTFALIWWSVFTVLTSVADHLFVASLVGVYGSFILVRFLIGSGESATYPNCNRTIAFWMSPAEKGLANGVVWSGTGIGYGVAPPLVALIMVHFSWRASFVMTGFIGILFAFVWYSYAKDRPEDHRGVNAAELAFIGADTVSTKQFAAPWRAIFRNRSVLGLVGSSTLLGYAMYVYISWFYLYLVNVRGFEVLRGAFFATGPFMAIAILSPVGGLASDRLSKRYGKRRGRRTVAISCILGATAAIFWGARAVNPYLAILLLSIGDGLIYAAHATAWATVIDIARGQSGAISGLMNTGANMGGVVSSTLTPILGAALGWIGALSITAALALGSAILWLLIEADRQIVRRD
jgi:MFS transporter, ACS family, glucarate transporter